MSNYNEPQTQLTRNCARALGPLEHQLLDRRSDWEQASFTELFGQLLVLLYALPEPGSAPVRRMREDLERLPQFRDRRYKGDAHTRPACIFTADRLSSVLKDLARYYRRQGYLEIAADFLQLARERGHAGVLGYEFDDGVNSWVAAMRFEWLETSWRQNERERADELLEEYCRIAGPMHLGTFLQAYLKLLAEHGDQARLERLWELGEQYELDLYEEGVPQTLSSWNPMAKRGLAEEDCE